MSPWWGAWALAGERKAALSRRKKRSLTSLDPLCARTSTRKPYFFPGIHGPGGVGLGRLLVTPRLAGAAEEERREPVLSSAR